MEIVFSSYGPDVMDHPLINWESQKTLDDFHDLVFDLLVDASALAVPSSAADELRDLEMSLSDLMKVAVTVKPTAFYKLLEKRDRFSFSPRFKARHGRRCLTKALAQHRCEEIAECEDACGLVRRMTALLEQEPVRKVFYY